jgi:hypothetical protein
MEKTTSTIVAVVVVVVIIIIIIIIKCSMLLNIFANVYESKDKIYLCIVKNKNI